MNIDLGTLNKVITTDDSPTAKRQREKLWELWDKNENGFVSLADIEDELCRNLNIQSSENIRDIINKSAEEVKRKF